MMAKTKAPMGHGGTMKMGGVGGKMPMKGMPPKGMPKMGGGKAKGC